VSDNLPLMGDIAGQGLFVVEEATVVDGNEKGEPLGFLFWLCVGWIGLNLIGAIFANVLPLQNPLFEDYNAINVGPGLHHLFGTDDLGRDIFARVVYGSRVSIAVGVGAMIIGFGIGAPLGMLRQHSDDAHVRTAGLSRDHRHHRRAFVLDATSAHQDHHRDWTRLRAARL
jgi:hypothetical protein